MKTTSFGFYLRALQAACDAAWRNEAKHKRPKFSRYELAADRWLYELIRRASS